MDFIVRGEPIEAQFHRARPAQRLAQLPLHLSSRRRSRHGTDFVSAKQAQTPRRIFLSPVHAASRTGRVQASTMWCTMCKARPFIALTLPGPFVTVSPWGLSCPKPHVSYKERALCAGNLSLQV